jgi:hypothetical protein
MRKHLVLAFVVSCLRWSRQFPGFGCAPEAVVQWGGLSGITWSVCLPAIRAGRNAPCCSCFTEAGESRAGAEGFGHRRAVAQQTIDFWVRLAVSARPVAERNDAAQFERWAPGRNRGQRVVQYVLLNRHAWPAGRKATCWGTSPTAAFSQCLDVRFLQRHPKIRNPRPDPFLVMEKCSFIY